MDRLSIESKLQESGLDWLAEQFAGLTTELPTILPSAWAEEKRYLSAVTSSMPGLYSYDVTPYLKEIIDCLSPYSSVHYVDFMKGVQIGGTSGVEENYIGYVIEHIKNMAVMYMTADAQLAKLRIEQFILPMIEDSGLSHLIRSNDTSNARKTGRTHKLVEWMGGGFLLPIGAQNPNRMRSVPIPILLIDECDAMKDNVGKNGDPITLAEARTSTFPTRKVMTVSTPLVAGHSKIHQRFLQGDQSKFYVPCPKCGAMQELRWSGVTDDGVVFGITWGYDDDGALDETSVRYVCKECSHEMRNEDKSSMLRKGVWTPTAKPLSKDRRSFHISALYSPPGMFSWADCVKVWLEAWDTTANKVKDVDKLQVFYNNILGVPFEVLGQKLTLAAVSSHRRREYARAMVPNTFARQYAGGEIHILTCAVDIQEKFMSVTVYGWTRNRAAFCIDNFRIKSDSDLGCSDIHDSSWGELQEFIEGQVYKSDDGKSYPIELTLIDSGYTASTVYEFVYRFRMQEHLVYPVKGEWAGVHSIGKKEWAPLNTNVGLPGYLIRTDYYKDRWGSKLRADWDRETVQTPWTYNVYFDITEKELKELTAETKVEIIDEKTGKSRGHQWKRASSQVRNEMWDTLCYNTAALEIFASNWCTANNIEVLSWDLFFSGTEGAFWYDGN